MSIVSLWVQSVSMQEYRARACRSTEREYAGVQSESMQEYRARVCRSTEREYAGVQSESLWNTIMFLIVRCVFLFAYLATTSLQRSECLATLFALFGSVNFRCYIFFTKSCILHLLSCYRLPLAWRRANHLIFGLSARIFTMIATWKLWLL
jgi:hypothetical protein